MTEVTRATREFVDRLRREQRRLGLSDSAFAKKLGVSRSVWVMSALGHRNVGMVLLAAAVRTFPELSGEALAYLKSYRSLDSQASNRGVEPTAPPTLGH